MKLRKSGILLHITSLPSDFGVGDLGRGAYQFADFLAGAGQTIWQVLPFNPASSACGNSPYCSFSAFAGNPLLIAPDLLVKDGYISPEVPGGAPSFDPAKVDYDKAASFKSRVLEAAYQKFIQAGDPGCRYANFEAANAHWLDDYALFTALKESFSGAPWNEWPVEIRDRWQQAIDYWTQRLAERIKREKFHQFLFFSQWLALKDYCNRKRIQLLGDVPIYVAYDSADVWKNPDNFKLGEDKKPLFVAGVPPDYFSETGQLWGNPVYRWEKMKENSYAWWVERMEHNLKYLDMVRLDHFRGFVAYWEVPGNEKTAVNGKWVKIAPREFFDTLLWRIPTQSIIAEDLGVITADVREIMNRYGFPGMKPLLFAFDGSLSTNPYIPYNHVENCIVYTGTHDNNTVKGWFVHDAGKTEKENLLAYFGRELDEDTIAGQLVRTAMMSVASTSIIPMQDFLELGAEARMNTPSVAYGNWEWRVTGEQLSAELCAKILKLTRAYGRI